MINLQYIILFLNGCNAVRRPVYKISCLGGGDQNDREWTCFVHVSMWSIAYPRLDFILSKPIYFFYKQVMTLTKVFLCSYNWSWPVKWLPQAAGHCDICSHKAHPAVLLEFQGPPWARGWHRALPVWATGGSGPQTSGQCHGQSEYQGECGKSVWLLMSF